jgi:serine O-acetyltransferase
MTLYIILGLLTIYIITALYYKDIQAVFHGDPAAKNPIEVLFYPGLQSISIHRIANILKRLNIPILPRVLSLISRIFTGIEIHPSATIGKAFFMDHGTGIVIGETAIIGNNVIIYHQVTLGGTQRVKGKRHPTIGNNVMIGAGSKILGNIHIGDNCKIGACSVVLKNVPKNSSIVGNPGRIIRLSEKKSVVEELNLSDIADPIGNQLHCLTDQVNRLNKKVLSYEKNNLNKKVDKIS